MEKPKIIFLGTPEFAVPSFQALIKNNLTPILVVTQPDKPVGRKQELVFSPVKQIALENKIPVFQPAAKADLQNVFLKYKPDICVLVAFGLIIPKKYLNQPRCGFLNIHPSLLPKYRGSSPIQTAVLNGDQVTGVTIIQLTPALDAGPIVAQEIINISPVDNAETLHDKLSQVGADLLIKTLPNYLAGQIKPKSQDDSQATYTKIINRQDGQINWQEKALEIDRQFRAFHPWPGVFSHLDRKRLKIVNLSVLEGDFSPAFASKEVTVGKPNLAPGEVFLGPNGELAVKCGQGAAELKMVQLEGKKKISGQEFLHGHKDLVGKILRKLKE